jgi:predicted nucleic acid-binding protein
MAVTASIRQYTSSRTIRHASSCRERAFASKIRYLLDTNTCIAAMRHHTLVLQRMAAVPPADCAISSITSYEQFSGVEKCADSAKEVQIPSPRLKSIQLAALIRGELFLIS